MVKRWINNCRTRYRNPIRLGANDDETRMVAASRKGPWVLSDVKPSKITLSNRFLAQKGFFGLFDPYQGVRQGYVNRRGGIRMHGGVG